MKTIQTKFYKQMVRSFFSLSLSLISLLSFLSLPFLSTALLWLPLAVTNIIINKEQEQQQ